MSVGCVNRIWSSAAGCCRKLDGTASPPTDCAGDQRHRRVALAFDRGLAGDQVMRAVGGDEVDDRGFVLEVAGEIDPALVGLEQSTSWLVAS